MRAFGSFHAGGFVQTDTGLRKGEVAVVVSSSGTGKTNMFSEEKTTPEISSTPCEKEQS